MVFGPASGVLVLVFSLSSALLRGDNPPPAPDFSSPKSAARSFYNAVETGDVVTLRSSMLAEGEQQRKLVDAFTDVITASGRLASAARDKFGAPGDALGMTAVPKEEAARIDKADERIDGDVATLTIPGRPIPLKFRRTGGVWKLVVTDFAGAKAENIDQQIGLLTQLAQILNETSADISAGKYASADQAQSAFQERVNAAMIKAAMPATKPATRQS